MLKKLMLTSLFCLTVCQLFAHEEDLRKENKIGKYQMAVDGDTVYILDTETGAVKRAPRGFTGWHTPELIIAPLENNE